MPELCLAAGIPEKETGFSHPWPSQREQIIFFGVGSSAALARSSPACLRLKNFQCPDISLTIIESIQHPAENRIAGISLLKQRHA